MNPIGGKLKIVLAPPILSMGINGCFLDPVQKTSTSSSYHSQQKWEKTCLLCLKYGYLSFKNAWLRYKGPLFTPRSRVRDVLLRMQGTFSTSSELDPANTRLSPWKGLEGPELFFNITPIGFLWKNKVTYTWDTSKASKTQPHFHFWVDQQITAHLS